MRRSLALLLLAASCASPAAAAALTLGVQAGPIIPNLRDHGGNDLSSGYSSRLAPFFGVAVELPLVPAWSIRAELDYASQGGQRNGLQPASLDPTQLGQPAGTTLYARFKNVAKLDYLEIPVLATFHTGPQRRLGVAFGPYLGFLLSAKSETSGSSPIYADKQGTQALTPAQDFSATSDDKNSLHALDAGLQAGLSAEQPLGPGALRLDVRAGLGLLNIQKDAADGKNTTGDLVVAVGYMWRVGPGGPR